MIFDECFLVHDICMTSFLVNMLLSLFIIYSLHGANYPTNSEHSVKMNVTPLINTTRCHFIFWRRRELARDFPEHVI